MSDQQRSEDEAAKAPEPLVSADVTERRGLDDDSPGEVRRTFIVLMIVGAIICTIPRQYGSALVMVGAAAVITVIHLVIRKRSVSSS